MLAVSLGANEGDLLLHKPYLNGIIKELALFLHRHADEAQRDNTNPAHRQVAPSSPATMETPDP
eukprot:2132799-Prorocentrum_lima.AAC.1